MSGLHELNVSLTKNGYFKVADVIAKHPRHEVLNKIRGTYAGINLDRAQIANMLSADPNTKELPEEWDEIRNYSKRAIDALVFISILFSHHTFITVFAKSMTAEMRGMLRREDLGDKVYTNLVYSMQTLGLCAYVPGADAIDYNLTPLFKEISIGPLVKRILTRKLATTGWKEPGPNDPFTRTFYEQCFHFGFHHTLGVSERQFQDWLEGQAVEVEAPPVLKVPNDMVTVSASLLAALAAKPFVIIAGTTGTGKTQTIRSCVKALCPVDTEPGFNHVFVPVEAGWTDSRHLLGYRNPFGRMGESYSTTPLLSLLLRANYPAHVVCPFFVILDEMNLSYVEMYFSRFLSLMETLAGGQPEAVLEPSELRLLLRSAPSAVEATYIEHAITSGGLFLSRNVFIVGTVNVDETTHMFSPKVLDRAFVLEFPTMLPSQKPDEFAIASADAVEGSVSDFWRYLVESGTIAPSKEDDAFLDAVYGVYQLFRMIPLSAFSIRTTAGAELHITLDRSLHAELGTVVDLPLDGASGEEDRSFVPGGQIAPKLAFEADESHWDVLEPLRLVENVEYTFSIIVPMPKADFERQSKRAGDGVFPFHNLKLKECITFNGPDSCRMLDSERCVVTGRLKFDNQLGGVDFSLREDIADLQLRAEVTSNKLDYEQDFQELLGQLAELHTEIILNLDAPTEIALRLSDKEPSIQMVLLHLRHLFHTQNLPLAVATIIGNPLSRHVARHALETTAFVTEPDWMQLQSAPSVLTWTAGGALAASFHGVTPETLPIRTIGNSCDTIENRFVKYSLKQLQQLIKDVRDRVGKSYQASRKHLAEWDALVDELLLHPLWQSVGECSVFPNSMVMYERHGYRDYMQGLMLLDLGLLIESDLGVIDRVTGDLKPIWALYEMWCYFELRTIVEKITGCPGEPTKAQLIRSKDFSTDLISGKTGCTRFQAQRATSTLDVNLYYNRSFESTTSDGNGRWSGSYSTKFRPDFSIEIIVGSHVHWVHFDAKYRVAFIPARTKTGDPMTVRTFQSEDVDRMHMYRDAILGTRGCYVLYPGNTNEETVFVRHPKPEYRKQWPGPSVGAFPLCPSSDANQEEQRIRLEHHLDRLIRAIEASAGYTEEEGFTGS